MGKQLTTYVKGWGTALLGVLLFLLGIQLITASVQSLQPILKTSLRFIVRNDLSTLGTSWLVTYVILNGSVTALIGLAVFQSGAFSLLQFFLVLCGSRLGSAAIVMFVGGLDYIQKKKLTLQDSCSLGILSFLVTFSMYIPITLLGYLMVKGKFILLDPPVVHAQYSGFLRGLGSASSWIHDLIGPGLSFVSAVVVIMAGFKLIDVALEFLDHTHLRNKYARKLRRPWISFIAGLLVTAMTTSVSFSLGIVVPLFNRRVVQRKEVIPYILGTSVGTLIDTLAAAFLMNVPNAAGVILLVMVLSMFIAGLYLLVYESYYAVTIGVHRYLLSGPRTFFWFLVALVAIPIILMSM